MAKGRLEGVVQARGRDRRDSGAVALAVIAPSGRARLRVQVDKRRPETIRLRGHGEVDSERGLPRAALLRDQGHCIHIDYPMCRALTCRALEGSIPIGAGRKPRVLFSGGRSAVAWRMVSIASPGSRPSSSGRDTASLVRNPPCHLITQPLGRGYQLRPVGVPSHLLPPPRGRPPPLGDCCWPRGQGALRRRSPWGWRRKRPPTRSRPPSSMSRADGVPSRPRERRSQASYRDGGRRLVPAEPLRPREGTRWRKRGAGASPGALAPRLREAIRQSRRTAGGLTCGANRPSPALRSRQDKHGLVGREQACQRLQQGCLACPGDAGDEDVAPLAQARAASLKHSGGPCAHTKKVSRNGGCHRTHARRAASAWQAPSVSYTPPRSTFPPAPHGAQLGITAAPELAPGRRTILRSSAKSSPATSGMAG